MERHGQFWTALEICRLYKLMMTPGCDSIVAARQMGRTEFAIIAKLRKGGLIDDDFRRINPVPGHLMFYRRLKAARQFTLPDVPPHLKSGKLTKILNRLGRRMEKADPIPENRRHLIPSLAKKQAKEKNKGSDRWWRFAHEAQANAFMRSFLYQRENGHCALCDKRLSEADYQAHHRDYDHQCDWPEKIEIVYRGESRKSVPDCTSCYNDDPSRFMKCAKRLCAVHGRCNKILAEAAG